MSEKSRRGRPTLRDARMVTVGVRVEPQERDLLKMIAEESGQSLCAFVRDVLRRKVIADRL